MKKIAVLSSGGDAPGMNAAIRAVIRTAIFHKLEVFGILRGYEGLLEKQYQPLELSSAANIIQRGGTILRTGRCMEFYKPQGRTKAAKNFLEAGFDALVAIGGDGTFTGAHYLWNEHQIPVVGVPGTIDNDVYGTDQTIGFDTAVNTALDAIDKIRDTAASHERLFIVEVMGRNSGHIATEVGLACGAEEIIIPENKFSTKQALSSIERGIKRGKTSSILVCAEGKTPGHAYEIAELIKKESGHEAKVCVLGHIQRGGSPTAADRNLASRLGAAAVDLLRAGQCDVMAGEANHKVVAVKMHDTFGKKKGIDPSIIELQKILAI